MKDYYQILGIAISASQEEIKRKFRFLSWAFHPDKFLGNSEQFKADAEATFKTINEAYEVLSDPQKRASYDKLRLAIIGPKQSQAELNLQETNVKIKQLETDIAKILVEWKIQTQRDRLRIIELEKELQKKNALSIMKITRKIFKIFSTHGWLFWGVPALLMFGLLVFFLPVSVPSPTEPSDNTYHLALIDTPEHTLSASVSFDAWKALQYIEIGDNIKGKGKILTISTNQATIDVGQPERRIPLVGISFFDPQVILVNMPTQQTKRLNVGNEIEFTGTIFNIQTAWLRSRQVKIDYVELLNRR